MIGDIVIWMTRIVPLIPQIASLWEAVSAKDERRTLDAALALRRKISDQQAREEIPRG